MMSLKAVPDFLEAEMTVGLDAPIGRRDSKWPSNSMVLMAYSVKPGLTCDSWVPCSDLEVKASLSPANTSDLTDFLCHWCV